MLRVVNMIPRTLSAESGQDSEPNIAVDPANPLRIVATAFTRDPANGPLAPVFVSTDGGASWQLRTIVPGGPITKDITIGFPDRGGTLYAGILRDSDRHMNVLRTADPFSLTPMTRLDDRAKEEDQPWLSAATVPSGSESGQDRVYIGHNDGSAGSRTASVELSLNARTAPQPAGFGTHQVERRTTAGQDGAPIRTAVHPSGTIYTCFQRYTSRPTLFSFIMDVIVVRDDDWGRGSNPFADLVGPDGLAGVAVATDRFGPLDAHSGPLGQERIGIDLSIAVDPTARRRIIVAWADRVGGPTGTDWTIHVRQSETSGQTWSDDVRTITNGKNPALAVNARGHIGLLFQQLVGIGAAERWVTQLEVTGDAWAGSPTAMVLHTALASSPPRDGFPYIGDYIRLLAVGNDYYGVFSGSNLPDPDNFPSGVSYQRNADFSTQRLVGTDNTTTVPVSIDPFFVHFQEPDPLPWLSSLL